ncbi:MAG: molecular chaperone [Candidatus Magasanikbacteria bacterium CG10_big_fil_rev_8_21_14_0_10_47_10]|uniref:Molecular chaperone n=1 Tax=Candidatus Magasanikbacteria bacterium CG10_big_fil_rev_8_21_14_0_10_47_10 TaxID=1974652 RepID=A0A2H0TQB2_9BACT|nr:MAG: molecular chaperone [Candidatus Magasanikbacteria bacterium CG10_big_fil_rev_8_21_14_0_10_47_10]
MALVQWDPFREMEEMLSRFPSQGRGTTLSSAFTPAVDIYEEGNNLIVRTPLAGVNPKDVEVNVENGLLTIKGEDKSEHEVDEKNYYRKEVRTGSFFRKIALPIAVDEEKVQAEFEDGILKVTAPKKADSPAKKVNVKVVKKET